MFQVLGSAFVWEVGAQPLQTSSHNWELFVLSLDTSHLHPGCLASSLLALGISAQFRNESSTYIKLTVNMQSTELSITEFVLAARITQI